MSEDSEPLWPTDFWEAVLEDVRRDYGEHDAVVEVFRSLASWRRQSDVAGLEGDLRRCSWGELCKCQAVLTHVYTALLGWQTNTAVRRATALVMLGVRRELERRKDRGSLPDEAA